jgi:NADH-quinone oxidoreductase subunit N
MFMEEAPDMSRIKEPRAIAAVLVFAIIFMVGFGVWHAPLLEFATKAVPHLGTVVPASLGIHSSLSQ